MFKLPAALMLSFVVVACSDEPAEPVRTTFACDNGARLGVDFYHGDEPRAVVNDGRSNVFVLPIGRSGSGYSYQSPTHRLRGKGRDATWRAPGVPPLKCREVHDP